MRSVLACLLGISLAFASADSRGVKLLSSSQYGLATRCSQAAHLAVYTANNIPQDIERLRFALDMQKKLKESQPLEKAIPTTSEVASAMMAVTVLWRQGEQGLTQQSHDTLVGEAAATCALENDGA